MKNKLIKSCATAVLLGTLGQPAMAGLLDSLGKVTDTIKKASDAVQSTGAPVGANPQTGQRTPANSGASYQLPMGLDAYPKADLKKRIDNPFDSVYIPLVVPINGPDGYLAPYTAQVEGRVTMLQYEHRTDDSPALILRHYQAWLTAQGFEMLTVCAMPCRALESGYSWATVTDASRRIDNNYLPSRPGYIAAYKPGSMVLVGVGSHLNQFTSFVKVVDGRVLDLSAWTRLTSPQQAAVPTSASTGTATTAAANGTGGNARPPADWDGPADWFGKYGWQWDRMPAGLKLTKTDFLNLPAVEYYADAVGNLPSAGKLKSTDAMVYRANSRNGFVLVGTPKGDVWVDSRQVRPISAKVEGAQAAVAGVSAALASAKPSASAFQDGAELVLKLKSAKLLASPSADGKVVAMLGSADGLVYMGAETGGYLQVTTAQGDGWVDKRLVKLP
ncbi:hypothetical protein [Chitinimonas naiadis]